VLALYPLTEWLPDAANTGTLSIATNVFPIANGYGPVKGFQAITEALPEAFYGGGAFIGSDGTASLLVGSANGLYLFSGSFSLVCTATATSPWRFAQFGDNVLCANGGKLISYSLTLQTASEVSSSPSNCIDVSAVRDFVMVIRADDTADLSEFNNSANWATGEKQADFQPLLGTGPGVAIVGGETALILERFAVQRIQYTGGDTIFQFDMIADNLGCMTRGSVASVNQMVFWLSERGFMMSPDRQSIVPIADEKFNRWFFANYSRADIGSMYAAVDPRYSRVMWAMPGDPGRIIAYNWALNKTSVIETSVEGVFTGFTNNISIEGVDELYPDGIDSVPVSLDDAQFQGGNPLLLVANSSGVVGTMEGDNLEARLQLDNIEPTPGRRSRIRSVRPVTDATNVAITVDARMRAGDSESIRSANTMRGNGNCPIRSNGRYNDIALTIPEGESWTYVQGVECEFEAGDGR
jgi:hypothetical protein